MPDRQDAIDIEALETMTASAPFALFMAAIDIELSRACGMCERGESYNDVLRAQGAAHALRAVVGLPKSMLSAMRKKVEPPLRSNKLPNV